MNTDREPGSMSELVILSTITNGIATLTLNRPEKKNSLSIALREEISDALQRLSADEDLRVLIITGAGRHFLCRFRPRRVPRYAARIPGEALAVQRHFAALHGYRPRFGCAAERG